VNQVGRETLRPSVLAALACGIVAVVVATLGSTAQVQLGRSIGGEARGAFDILVRPANASDLKLSSTNGLIEPNYLSFAGAGGISLGQLSRIRSVAGVEIAAPISVVGQVTGAWDTPVIDLPPTFKSEVVNFTLTQRVTDGVSNRVVSRQHFRALLPASSTIYPSSTGAGSFVAGDAAHGWYLTGLPLPPVTSSVVAVDPLAEEKLLGHPVRALTQLAELRGRSSGTFTAKSLNSAMVAAMKDGKFSPGNLNPGNPRGEISPVVPVMVSAKDPSSGTITVTGSVVGEGAPVDAALSNSTAAVVLSSWPVDGRVISSTTATVAANLEPLQSPKLTIGLGTKASPQGAGGPITQIDGLRIDRPTYQPTGASGAISLRITSEGEVPSNGPKVPLHVDPETQVGETKVIGKEQSYRKTQTIKTANNVAFYPVGNFTASQMVPHSPDQGRVSMGAYDIPEMTIESSKIANKGTVLRPTLNPAGLVVRAPVAIADIRDAVLLRGTKPIDAVRIRVSGIKIVDAAAQQRVQEVASEIADLGLQVDVVIGSSPQLVSISVPNYVTANDTTKALGTVTQGWTTLGAATRVSRGLSTTTVSLVTLAAATALVAALSAQYLEGAVVRRDSAILQVTGWSRRRIYRRYIVGPALASLLSVLVFGVVWFFSARDLTMGVIGVAVCLLVPAGTFIGIRRAVGGVAFASARTGDFSTARTKFLSSNRTLLALRLVTATPARSAAIVTLIAIGTAAIGLSYSIFEERVQLAGPTFLAQSLIGSLTAQHVLISLVASVVAASFAVSLWRYAVRHRSRDERNLRAVGWRKRDRARLRRTMLAWQAIPAIAVGVVAGTALSSLTGAQALLETAGVALAGGCVLLFLMVVAGQPYRDGE
jgi:putative ABC transport system permease protein